MVVFPPFYKENPILWYEQVECVFIIEKIVNNIDKYLHFVGSVHPDVLNYVSDIVERKTMATGYDEIKCKIISDFKRMGEREFSKLFQGKHNITEILALPTFLKQHPAIYFKQLKAIFTIAHITSDEDQFLYFMANLDPIFIPVINRSPDITTMSGIQERILLHFDPWAALLGVKQGEESS